jgi:hypothetical protein
VSHTTWEIDEETGAQIRSFIHEALTKVAGGYAVGDRLVRGHSETLVLLFAIRDADAPTLAIRATPGLIRRWIAYLGEIGYHLSNRRSVFFDSGFLLAFNPPPSMEHLRRRRARVPPA